MFNYTLIQWIFFFYLYCFLGWCWESSYVSIKSKKWVNRGFMRGPFLPLYGSGGMMMLIVSKPFVDNIVLTYIAGCIGATILELVTGILMERLFHFRYWDYSNQKIQYKGYICLSSTLFWGFLTIFMTRFIHQPIEDFVFRIPSNILEPVTYILTLYIAADFALSFKAARDMSKVLEKLDKAKNELIEMQKKLAESVESTTEQVRMTLSEKKQQAGDVIAEGKVQVGEAFMEKREQAEKLLAELSEIKDNFKPELSEKWEEKVRALYEFMDEKGLDNLTSFREEYKARKQQLSEGVRAKERIKGISISAKKRFIRSNPHMKSERFATALEELKQDLEEHQE